MSVTTTAAMFLCSLEFYGVILILDFVQWEIESVLYEK